MLDINHSTQFDTDTTINDAIRERVPALEDLILDLLEGEFAGVIRSHVRDEVYGGD